MVSHRLGQMVSDDTINTAIQGQALIEKHYVSFRQHLKRNGIDLSQTYITLGEALKIDPKAERFVDNELANRLLTRDYRKTYAVPEDA